MADVDEDVIPRSGPNLEETDLSDETQDFRFLATVSHEDAKIPKRGEKDFEPHATVLQSNTLAASRDAMHNALSFRRIHAPRNHVVATYHPESNMAYALNPKGVSFTKMGHVLPAKEDPIGNDEVRGQRVWLLPEEVLYLVERGTLDVHWPAEEEEDEHSIPMSLQAAYAMFIGNEQSRGGALSFERYSVYSALKRMGYTVLRAPSFNGPGEVPGRDCQPPLGQRAWQIGLLRPSYWWKALWATPAIDDSEQQRQGPLVCPDFYRSYADIYKRLALIKFYDPTLKHDFQPTDPAFRTTYHVWKPGSTTFKKSDPGVPDFRIAVVNARETSAPTLDQLSALLDSTPYKPPPEQSQMYQKLKHGYRDVILAVVDQGVTSYLRIADAAFGREKLYERKGRAPGGKRGGRGGGRGRGR